MVNEIFDFYVLVDDQWTFYNTARISCLLNKNTINGKVIHIHGSFPDSKAEEGEQINSEKIKAENIQLRDISGAARKNWKLKTVIWKLKLHWKGAGQSNGHAPLTS